MIKEINSVEYNELIELAEKNEERISSTHNLAINKKLFSILRKAADSLKGAEERTKKIERFKTDLENEKNAPSSFSLILIAVFVVVGIICAIVAYRNNYSESSIIAIRKYAAVYGNTAEDREFAQMLLDGKIHRFGLDKLRKYGEYVFPLRWFIGSFKGWFIISAVVTAILSLLDVIVKKNHLKKYIPIQEKKIQEATQELQKYILENENILCMVPRACTSSAQLYKVISLYETGKADNLKEALNLADTAEFREDVRSGITTIIAGLNSIVGYLEGNEWF